VPTERPHAGREDGECVGDRSSSIARWLGGDAQTVGDAIHAFTAGA